MLHIKLTNDMILDVHIMTAGLDEFVGERDSRNDGEGAYGTNPEGGIIGLVCFRKGGVFVTHAYVEVNYQLFIRNATSLPNLFRES